MLGIGTINKKGKVRKPDLDIEFFPSKIPDYHNRLQELPTTQSTIAKTVSKSTFSLFDMKEIQIIDEVLIKANKRESKIEKF